MIASSITLNENKTRYESKHANCTSIIARSIILFNIILAYNPIMYMDVQHVVLWFFLIIVAILHLLSILMWKAILLMKINEIKIKIFETTVEHYIE